jgi:hypothetical protein
MALLMVLLFRCLRKRKNQDYDHFSGIINDGTIVMFDRIAEGVDCDKVIVDDLTLHVMNTAPY